jgi:hypothetical protein
VDRGGRGIIGAPGIEHIQDWADAAYNRASTGYQNRAKEKAGSLADIFRAGGGMPPADAANLEAETERYKADAAVRAAQARQATTGQGAGSGSGVSAAYLRERVQRVTDAVDRVVPEINNWTTGMGGLLKWAPMTDARHVNNLLEPLRSNIAFSELTDMRAASKSGGALGQVSDREGILLQSSLGSLDTLQSPQQVLETLNTIKATIRRWNAAKMLESEGRLDPQTFYSTYNEGDFYGPQSGASAVAPSSDAPAGGGGAVYYDMNGNPIRR